MQRGRAVRFPNNTPDPEDHANSASRPSVHNAPRTLAARPATTRIRPRRIQAPSPMPRLADAPAARPIGQGLASSRPLRVPDPVAGALAEQSKVKVSKVCPYTETA